MTRRYRVHQVDVFTEQPLCGNPLAVFADAVGLSDDEMQAIAREMNLSETTFVLPADAADADYRVRIYTPGEEIPFAGHPTLGTAHVLLETGAVERDGERFDIFQQTLAGTQRIAVDRTGDGLDLTMTQPTPEFSAGPSAAEIAAALRVSADQISAAPATISVGVAWHVAEIASLEVLHALEPDMTALAELGRKTGYGVTIFCEGAADPSCAVRVRSFAPHMGVPEDPVCGSGNGCVGAYRARRDQIESARSHRAEQGIEVRRPGTADVCVTPVSPAPALEVQVGGRCVTLLEGDLLLPS